MQPRRFVSNRKMTIDSSYQCHLLASGDIERHTFMKETISIEYLSSGSRVPDKLRDRVPGNKLPGYGSPTKHQQALQFHKERTRLFTGSIPRLRVQSN